MQSFSGHVPHLPDKARGSRKHLSLSPLGQEYSYASTAF